MTKKVVKAAKVQHKDEDEIRELCNAIEMSIGLLSRCVGWVEVDRYIDQIKELTYEQAVIARAKLKANKKAKQELKDATKVTH